MREELAESVLEVKRVSDRLMVMKLEVKGSILNIVSAYAPQVNNSMEEKYDFWEDLDGLIESVIKDENGNVMVNSEAVLKRWKEYFEKLMNEENDRDPRTKEAEVVNKKVNCVSREEVKNALRRMK